MEQKKMSKDDQYTRLSQRSK